MSIARRRAVGSVALMAVLAACSSAGSDDRSSAGTTTTAGASTSTVAASARPQTVTVTPSSGLHDKQVVHVVGKGFTPGQTGVGIIQCADKGGDTGQDDCYIGGIKVAAVDSSGTVDADFPVTAGPFGGDGVVCSNSQPCLISVTQLTLTPTEFASAPIDFR